MSSHFITGIPVKNSLQAQTSPCQHSNVSHLSMPCLKEPQHTQMLSETTD